MDLEGIETAGFWIRLALLLLGVGAWAMAGWNIFVREDKLSFPWHRGRDHSQSNLPPGQDD